MKISLNPYHEELPQRWLSGTFLPLWCSMVGVAIVMPVLFLFAVKRAVHFVLFDALLLLHLLVFAPLMTHRAAVVYKKCIAAFRADLSDETSL